MTKLSLMVLLQMRLLKLQMILSSKQVRMREFLKEIFQPFQLMTTIVVT